MNINKPDNLKNKIIQKFHTSKHINGSRRLIWPSETPDIRLRSIKFRKPILEKADSPINMVIHIRMPSSKRQQQSEDKCCQDNLPNTKFFQFLQVFLNHSS